MFAVHKPASRLYGTFQWQIDLSSTGWTADSEDNVGTRVTSSIFRLCSYLWRLELKPKGTASSPRVHLFLHPAGSPPAEAIDFQLWIQNHTDADKSATRGTVEWRSCFQRLLKVAPNPLTLGCPNLKK
ncbi:hypothetical protein ABBQ38_000655 [Trebouxia sp. C0009 RCD-2024]